MIPSGFGILAASRFFDWYVIWYLRQDLCKYTWLAELF